MAEWHEWTDEEIATWQQALIAVRSGDLETLTQLADQRFDFTKRGPGWTGAIYVARTVYRDDPPVSLLEMVIEHGEDPQIVTFLLRQGIDPNESYWHDMTPLGHAVDTECQAFLQGGIPMDCRFIRPLLEAGADPTLSAADGEAAIEIARSYQYDEAVSLMERGV